MIFEILFILILLVINGVFSMSEMAVVSARKARLQKLADDGAKGASAALDLAENPGSFLSTVQVGITLVGILAGAFGGASIAEKLTPVVATQAALEPYAEQISFGMVVAIITYLSLVIGELIPKRLALHSPDKIASLVAGPMKALSRVCYPLVRVLEGSTNGLLRLFGLRESTDPPVTEDEIKVLIEQGIHAGVFETAERDLIERTFHLGDRSIKELMIPRPEVVFLDIDDPPEKLKEAIIETRFSRYPVSQGSFDKIVGFLRVKDLLGRPFGDSIDELKNALVPPLFIPEATPAFKAIELFKSSRRHMALVIDEYGGVEGLVTVNDILDALVGDFPSVDEQGDEMIVQREDGSYLLDGGVSLGELKQTLGLKHLPGEERGGFQTLGGFVMTHLGRIPKEADHLETAGWRFEVVDMDQRRVDKVLISLVSPAPDVEI
jgi:putative hemolysin